MAAGRSVCRFRFLFFFHVICNTFVFCQFIVPSIQVYQSILLFLLYTICYQRAKHIANAKSTHLSALTDKNFLQCHRLLLDRFPILCMDSLVFQAYHILHNTALETNNHNLVVLFLFSHVLDDNN